jgi:broad specificity phosphatase PhoE
MVKVSTTSKKRLSERQCGMYGSRPCLKLQLLTIQCYWSKLDGNGTITWDNAELTATGISQALVANKFWRASLSTSKIPAPESYYVSPLERCLSTANYTFSGLDLPPDRPFKPIIKELLREALGVHTCDRRYSKSKIQSMWPEYAFEANFEEDDQLWEPELRESPTHEVFRLQLLLDDIFANDKNTFISLTSHSGAISSILRGIGHREFQLQTGAIIPVFLMGQRREGPRPVIGIDPPTKAPSCETPPVVVEE